MSMIDLGHWELADNLSLPDDWDICKPLGFVYKITNKETGKFYIRTKEDT